jgi:hypothetical protein
MPYNYIGISNPVNYYQKKYIQSIPVNNNVKYYSYNYVSIKNKVVYSTVNKRGNSFLKVKTQGYNITPDPNNPESYNWISFSLPIVTEAGANVYSKLDLNNIQTFYNYVRVSPNPQEELKMPRIQSMLELSAIEKDIPTPSETTIKQLEEFKIGDSVSKLTVAALRVFIEYFYNMYDLGDPFQYDELLGNVYNIYKDEDNLQNIDYDTAIGWFNSILTKNNDALKKVFNVIQEEETIIEKGLFNILSGLKHTSNNAYFNFLFAMKRSLDKTISNYLSTSDLGTFGKVIHYMVNNSFGKSFFIMNKMITSVVADEKYVFNYLMANDMRRDSVTEKYIAFNRVKSLATVENNISPSSLSSYRHLGLSETLMALENPSNRNVNTFIFTNQMDVFRQMLSDIQFVTNDISRKTDKLLIYNDSNLNYSSKNFLINQNRKYKYESLTRIIDRLSSSIGNMIPDVIPMLYKNIEKDVKLTKYNWVRINAKAFLKTDKAFNWIRVITQATKYYYNYVRISSMKYCQQPIHGIRYLIFPYKKCADVTNEKLRIKAKLFTGETITFDVRVHKLGKIVESFENIENKINHKIVLKSNTKGFIPEFPAIYLKVMDGDVL